MHVCIRTYINITPVPKVQKIYWGTKVWNIDIDFVVFKKKNSRTQPV